MTANYITSATSAKGFPATAVGEVAFAGRSNVGKSSLLNKLAGVKKLARTSNTPGRTRAINWFSVSRRGKEYNFVDLPGYGYAKVSRSMRNEWGPLIETYLEGRPTLKLVIILIDIRRGTGEEELGLIEFLGHHQIPCHVVVTKGDKVGKAKRKPTAMAIAKECGVGRAWTLVSSITGDGMDDLWRVIAKAVYPS